MTLYIIRHFIAFWSTFLCLMPIQSAAQLWVNEKEGVIYPRTFTRNADMVYRYNGRSLTFKQLRSLLWSSPISKPYMMRGRTPNRIGAALILTGLGFFVASQNVPMDGSSGKKTRQNLYLATSLFSGGIGFVQLLKRNNHIFKGMNAFNKAAIGNQPGTLMRQPDSARIEDKIALSKESDNFTYYYEGKKISIRQMDSLLEKSEVLKKPYMKMQRSKKWIKIGAFMTGAFFTAFVITGLQRDTENPNYVQSNGKDNRFVASMVGLTGSALTMGIAAFWVKEHRNSAFKLYKKAIQAPIGDQPNKSTTGISSITLGFTNNSIGLAVHF